MSGVQASPAGGSQASPPRWDFPLPLSQPTSIFETHCWLSTSSVLGTWFQSVLSGLFQLQVTLKRNILVQAQKRCWVGVASGMAGSRGLCIILFMGSPHLAAVRGKVAPRSLNILHLVSLSKYCSIHFCHPLFHVP